jgi:hypothetical protein
MGLIVIPFNTVIPGFILSENHISEELIIIVFVFEFMGALGF